MRKRRALAGGNRIYHVAVVALQQLLAVGDNFFFAVSAIRSRKNSGP